tara:strand:- start:230 stop:1555 length:1326 start_codon:yes stop_codon:yes gene_type:complete
MKTSVFGVLVCSLCVASAFAQDQDEGSSACFSGSKFNFENDCIEPDDLLGMLDLTTPDNPLMALSGISPETIIKPKAGDKLALSYLPQVADTLGNEQYSIGFEVNPGLLAMPRQFTMAEYLGKPTKSQDSVDRARKLKRAKWLSFFNISGFAAKSADNGISSKYGVGVSYQYDKGALLQAQGEYAGCVRKKYTINGEVKSPSEAIAILEGEVDRELTAAGNGVSPDPHVVRAVAEERFSTNERFKSWSNPEEVVSKCLAEASPWNRLVVGAGAAILRSETSTSETVQPLPPATQEGLEKTGTGVWASYAGPSPLDKRNGQVSIGAKWTDNLARTRKEGDQTIIETVDGWQIGGRYTQNVAEKKNKNGVVKQSYRAFAEIAYAEERFGGMTDKFTQAGVGLEIQVQKNIMFQAVFGDTFGSDIDRGTYLSGQLKWSFSQISQ